jgi:hypothetical protein
MYFKSKITIILSLLTVFTFIGTYYIYTSATLKPKLGDINISSENNTLSLIVPTKSISVFSYTTISGQVKSTNLDEDGSLELTFISLERPQFDSHFKLKKSLAIGDDISFQEYSQTLGKLLSQRDLLTLDDFFNSLSSGNMFSIEVGNDNGREFILKAVVYTYK